jgi:hypothetical protein
MSGLVRFPIMDWFGPQEGPEWEAFTARWEAEFERLNGRTYREMLFGWGEERQRAPEASADATRGGS